MYIYLSFVSFSFCADFSCCTFIFIIFMINSHFKTLWDSWSYSGTLAYLVDVNSRRSFICRLALRFGQASCCWVDYSPCTFGGRVVNGGKQARQGKLNNKMYAEGNCHCRLLSMWHQSPNRPFVTRPIFLYPGFQEWHFNAKKKSYSCGWARCSCSQKQITHERYIFPKIVFSSSSFPTTIELVEVRGLKAGSS